MSTRWWMSGLFAAGLLAGLAQVALLDPPWQHLYSDALGYIDRAAQLAAGGLLSPYETFFPLGLSYFYSLFFVFLDESSALYWIAFLQIIAMAASHVLVYLTGRLLFDDETVARLASLLSLLYWPFTAQLSTYMAEPVFTCLLLAGQYLMLSSLLRGRLVPALAGGLLIGLAAIIKTQGLIILVSAVLLVVMFRRKPLLLLPMIAILAVPVLLHAAHLAAVRGETGFATPANGAFNLYLGQSARAGIGIRYPADNIFLFFYNNNTRLQKGLLTPEIFQVNPLDQQFFMQRTFRLVKEQPLRQLLRTLQSGFELHTLEAHWPLRNTPGFARAETLFKQAAVLLFYLPALIALAMSLRIADIRFPVIALALPLLGITGAAAIAMGQPRYLLPFLPNLILLGSFGLLAIHSRLTAWRKPAASDES